MADSAGRLAFAAPRSHGANRYDRHAGFEHGRLSAQLRKGRAAGIDQRPKVHDVFMRNIAVGKHHFIDAIFFYHIRQRFFRLDGDSTRVERSRQLGGIFSVVDIGYLRGGESHDRVFFMIPKNGIKIMKVPSGSAGDDNSS